jgi:L-ascorbate metabolism protein UlaG (beta-lactamase superfamily)
MKTLIQILVLTLATSCLSQSPTKQVKVTYVGNEGVMLESGETKITIDATHKLYPREPFYRYLTPELLEKMERAQAPFDGIDMVLVTHYHSDHFHPETTGLYLRNSSSSKLYGARQISSAMQYSADFPKVQSQLEIVNAAPGEKTRVNESVTAFGIPHGQDTQHLGYVVRLGGKTLAHFGDADFQEENLRALRLTDEKIDVALIPFWVLDRAETRALIAKYIAPKQIVAIHIPPRDEATAAAELKNTAGADAFTKLMETRIY